MTLKATSKRLLALLLLLTMVLGLFPVPTTIAAETETTEEPSQTQTGKDYTADIEALEKPAASYGKYHSYRIDTVDSKPHGTIDIGDYVMLVKITEENTTQAYALAIGAIVDEYSATVPAVPVTIDGDYVYFSDEDSARNATITTKENTLPKYAYERLFVRRDGQAVVGADYNGTANFRVVSGGSNETFGFNYQDGTEGMTAIKNIKHGTDTNRTPYYVVYDNTNSEFFFGSTSTYAPHVENTKFYFYQTTNLTQDLYNAITAAKAYATGNKDGKYDPELYAGFAAMLEECIQVYQDLNHYLTKEERENWIPLRDALNSRAKSLNAYMKVLDAAASAPNYPAVMSELPDSIGWKNYCIDFADKQNPTDYTGLDGSYFIVVRHNSIDYVIDPSAEAPTGSLKVIPVSVGNGSVNAIDGKPISELTTPIPQAIDMIYETNPTNANNNCYYLRAYDGTFFRPEYLKAADQTTLARGAAHQSMGIRYISGNSNRIYFYRNAYIDTSGTSQGNHYSRLTLNPDDFTVTMKLQEESEQGTNYRLFRLTWNTAELLDAIREMASYATDDGNTVSGVYQNFLKCLDESIAMFLQYNVNPTAEQLEQTTVIQSKLKAQVIRLRSYKDILKSDYSQIIENLSTPYNELYRGPLSRYHNMDIRLVTGGVYYIVHHNTGDTGPDGWAWTPDDDLYVQDANNRIYGAPVEISDGHVVNGQPVMAFHLKKNLKEDNIDSWKNEFAPWPVYNTTFYVNKGEFIPDNSTPNAVAFAYGRQVAFELHVYDDGFTMRCNKNFDGVTGNENYYVQYKPELDGFRPYLMEAIEEEVSLFHLYRVSSQVLDLYNAIQQVAVYATGNKDDRYPTDKYNAFLDCLQESINLYQYYNTSLVEGWNEETLKKDLDGKAEELLSHIGILTLADTKVNYIDIPVEILDFRADGFMIEYEKGNYGLNSIGDLAAFYGEDFAKSLRAYATVTPEGSPSTVAQGLTLPYLVAGNMVYTEATLKQVAYSLMAGLYKQQDNIPNQSNQVKTKVDALATEVSALIPESPNWSEIIVSPEWLKLLGAPTDTYSKTTTPTQNGGELAWDKIETAYDLAYYILNYLWRPVAATDKQSNGDIYNVSVPQRSVFRMFRDEDTGLYTLDAYNRVEYTDSYIYNAYPITDNYIHYNSPNFTPIDGLGFESPDDEGNTAPDTDRSQYLYDSNNYSTNGTNFHFTVHAHGSFVYYEEQDLYFEFLGDDDVYFYVDGQRVMDLGGGHAAASGTLDLNTVAKDLGLVDGGVYTFDMFYAERKTTASNLKFSTNIRIFNTDTQTLKSQYGVQLNGETTVDPETEKGISMGDNATVRVGDVIAYSFDLINTREVPVLDLEFHDPSLGVDLTKDAVTTYTGTLEDGSEAISLTNPDADHANGVITQLSDLLLEYCALDTGGKPLSQNVTNLTPEEILPLLREANHIPDGVQNHTFSSLEPGVYRVRVETIDNLKALLEAGLPMKCSLSIYGFLRKTTAEDLPYENALTTKCYYPSSMAGSTEFIPITGSASRQIRVLEHSSTPQVRKLEVVLDYGKAVSVPLEEISDLIHFEDGSPVKVGSVVGFVNSNSNGYILKKLPSDIFCTQVGKQVPGIQGTYCLGADDFTFTPNQFLDQVEQLYAVVEVENFYYGTESTEEFHYVLAELTFTPATMVYYETDFSSDIFTLKQIGGGEDWTLTTDGTNAADSNQDYERLNGTVYHTDIAPEYIPAEAFFVDFDGEGYERRYRDNPQYSGIDFDKETAWYSHNVRNTIYNKHTLNSAAGTMELTNLTSKNESGSYLGAWIQTIIPGGDIGSEALRLYAGEGHYAQIRFRVENCKSYAGSGNISLFFSNSKDEETDGDIAIEAHRSGRLALTNDEVLTGDYMTVRIPLDYKPYYANSEIIDTIRLYIAGYTDDGTGKGKITVDYIYVGPEMGMEDDVYGNYLFVGFDNAEEDHLRYGSSIYGANTSGKTYRDLDQASAWVSSSAKTSIQILKGLENDPNNGYIYFEDKLDDSTLGEDSSKNYNYIHAGSFVNSNDVTKGYNLPIAYASTRNDFCQIRFKIEDASIVSGETLAIGIEFQEGYICGRATLDESHLNGKFHTVTFPMDAPYWHKYRNEENATLEWLHPIIYNAQGKSGSTGAKFTIDYIFIGPEHMLDRVSQHVTPEAEKVNHLFFDFNNNDAAKLRYTNPIYGNTVTNYDLPDNWSVDNSVGDTVIESFDSVGGTVTFKDNNEKPWNYIHTGKNYYNTPLAYTPGTNDYLRIRMKINKGSTGTAPTGIMAVSLENFEEDNFFSYGTREYSFADYADGKYHIFTVPLNTEDYLKEDLLTAVRPVISGTQNCSFTVDYIYVGPLTESNPSSPSLYFGFGNRGSGHWNTDSIRYDSDTYGFLNYDTNRWLSESESVASNLTTDVYGWKTAGNENRGTPPEDVTIHDYIPSFPPEETVTYPNIAVTPQPDTGNLELVVDVKEGETADVIAIQTYPSVTSPGYYWRHFMQMLNYHPAQENIVQIRFKTEGLTIGENFAVKLMYLPTGADAFITSDPLQLAPLKELNPEEDYVVLTAQLDDTFNNAPAIERLRLVFEGVTAEKGDKILIDYIYAGVGKIAPEPVYGYDSSYLNDPMLSNGSSFVVEGQGVKLGNSTTYTEASFSFRGTGFDLISRTGAEQATIRLQIFSHATNTVKKTITVNNKGELELYQIPVVSVQGLDYGDYTVTFWVNKAINGNYEFLNRGGEFHFDALRIYDPLGKNGNTPETPLVAYRTDLEAYPHVKEIRNILLSAENFESLTSAGTGAIFVDSEETPSEAVPATDANGDPTGETVVVKPEGIQVTGHYTANATTYNKIGPKNEVYLAPGQAVAFMLQISTTLVPDSVDIGVKTIQEGSSGNLVAGIVTKGTTGSQLLNIASRKAVTVSSATAQYYALPIDETTFFTEGDSRYCYIVLYNSGTIGDTVNVLSLTDVKIAYDTLPVIGLPQDAPSDPEIMPDPTEATTAPATEAAEGSTYEPTPEKRSSGTYFDFVVDGHALDAAALVMKAVLETPILEDGFKIGHSLNLASDIALNYAVKKTDLDQYDSFYLECFTEGSEEPIRLEAVEKGDYYYFTLEGLTAVQMTETVAATLYMEKNGRVYYTETDHYSIADYAYGQLAKDRTPEKLKILCAQLLRYGSMAQIFKAYRTDSLADAAMTEEQKALLTDLSALTFTKTNHVLSDITDPKATWAGKTLALDSRVTIRYVVDIAGDVNPEDLSLRVRYEDYEGNEKEMILTQPQAYGNKAGRYCFDFDGLLAAELRTVLYTAVYEEETQISNTLVYSAETYCAGKTGSLGDVCKALMAYCDAAKDYFS